jgi:hypothetical protein
MCIKNYRHGNTVTTVAYVVLPSYRPKTAASLGPKFTGVKEVRNLRAMLMADLLNPEQHSVYFTTTPAEEWRATAAA